MADDTKTSVGTKILLVLGAILAIWLAANLFGTVVRWAISLIGYIIVAVIAYHLGKISARNDD